MKNNKEIKLFLTDCDGVLTDAGMYYFEDGNEAKKFNTRDGMAFKLLREQNIKIGIITGENTTIVKRRSEKLKMDFTFMGVEDKVKCVEELIKKIGITYDNILYVGDDINDLKLLQKVGISCAPKDAVDEVLEVVNYISPKQGGEGVIRDVYNHFFRKD